MQTNTATTGQIDQLVRDHLRERGVRYTRARQAVIKAIGMGDGPQSAAELHNRLKGIVPLSSLYRSLAVLEASGILAPHLGTRGVTRYELAEWLSGHHHHLVCIECGKVVDVELDPSGEDHLEDVVSIVSRSAGFSLTGHTLEIEGQCPECAHEAVT